MAVALPLAAAFSGLAVVLRHALTVVVKHAEVAHGAREAFLSGLLVPVARPDVVLRYALTVGVKQAEVKHGFRVALVRRPFALRLLGFVQGLLALGLSCSHRLKLLALGARSRLCLLFARADEVQVKGCGLGCTLGPARHPVFCLSNIIA